LSFPLSDRPVNKWEGRYGEIETEAELWDKFMAYLSQKRWGRLEEIAASELRLENKHCHLGARDGVCWG